MKLKWIILGGLLFATSALAQMDMNMDMGTKPGSSKFARNTVLGE